MTAGSSLKHISIRAIFGAVLFLLFGLAWLPALPSLAAGFVGPQNPTADLSIAMTAAPNPVALGSNLTFSMTVSNAGPDNATNVSVNDSLPMGLAFISAVSSQGTCDGYEGSVETTIYCDLGSISAGSQVTISVVTQPVARGPVTNTASVSGEETDPNPDNNTASEIVQTDSTLTYQLVADVNGDGKVDVLDFHLISVPVIYPCDNDPLAVFGPGLARYNPGKIGIYQCASGSGNYRDYKKGISAVAPGQGYWVITAKDRKLVIPGESLPPYGSYSVPLHPGWNIVGFPFLKSLDSGYVTVRNGEEEYQLGDNPWVQNQAWGYDKGYYPVIGTSGSDEQYLFKPWNAYWMYNNSDQEVEVVFNRYLKAAPNTSGTARQFAAVAPNPGIAFTVKEAGKKYRDATLFLGIDADASAELDSRDCLSPPPISTDVPRLYVDHSGWRDRPGKYARDFRPFGQCPVVFKVTLEVPDKDVATSYIVKWNLGSLDSGTKAKLTGAAPPVINMRRAAGCTVTVPAHTTKCRLTVKLVN
ncbi:MAG: hypothetical protein ABFD97_19755 [Syntrophobacter sp.]